MGRRSSCILQVNTFDVAGGAEKVAWNLFKAYRAAGHESWLAVGRKRTKHPNVLRIPNDEAPRAWSRFWWRAHNRLQPVYPRAWGRRLCRFTHRLAEPGGWLDSLRGREDFHYPGTRRLLAMTPRRPDLVHCHNLHSLYFDLRVLPWLSGAVPVVLTLHDAWLFTGHCAHSFDCERWNAGCGKCPDLSLYPPVRRDATAYNWERKRDIYSRCKLRVATPSRWLMEKAERSMLWPGVVEDRVIPNGVDLSVFYPSDMRAARTALGWPQDARVLLFSANGIRENIWKDYQTLRDAVARIARQRCERRLLFIALGESGQPERVGEAEVQFIGYQEDRHVVARCYQAADVYVHASRADTFPNSVIEALACGTPVVATAVGGIPEQVKCLSPSAGQTCTGVSTHDIAEATGALVPQGDAEAMAFEVERLLDDESLRHRLGDNAADDAAVRFDLRRQVDAYLDWYHELLDRRTSQLPQQPKRCIPVVETVAAQ